MNNVESCLMPLCPTCICTHMEMHIKEGKCNPKFDNINESYSTVVTEIRKFNEKFGDSRDQLVSIHLLRLIFNELLEIKRKHFLISYTL